MGYSYCVMKTHALLAAAAMVLIFQAQFKAAGQASHQCTSPDTAENPLGSFQVEPDTAGELSRMRQAPHGALRPGKHLLVVHWRAGARRFEDKSPYMQGTLDGLYWTEPPRSAFVGPIKLRSRAAGLPRIDATARRPYSLPRKPGTQRGLDDRLRRARVRRSAAANSSTSA